MHGIHRLGGRFVDDMLHFAAIELHATVDLLRTLVMLHTTRISKVRVISCGSHEIRDFVGFTPSEFLYSKISAFF